ncbi:MAG TPA: FAD-dependent oxidoreductase, partial [Candidatus Ozemobacteraceae bacterium]|nr:FAD-dependent oxidoreductase [Candidatus Ozemobacteraceae bacterium]
GCPPDEIEKIGRYLIEEQKLHTTIKLNPTLLGPRELRHILNEELGWGTEVPDLAFEHDLKYPDALKLIKNLRDCAKKAGVHFGLKLTNTLESINNKKVFPPNEKMMYMSGRALHPISVKVGQKLQNEFKGELDLSFSAGADCYNISDLLACNIKPVTVCSDILKPGGYMRLTQYLEEARQHCAKLKVKDIESLVKKTAGGKKKPIEAALANLNHYADQVTGNPAYRKDSRLGEHIKTGRPLTTYDCVQAPCIGTCPANQDIPKYLYQVAQGNDAAAMEVILRTNPLPNVAGLVCDHQCQTKCTRLNYDQPLLIREIKRFVAERQKQQGLPQPAAPNGLRVAIIGAGPSGLACAYFLVQDGFQVDVFETKTFAGGMISDAIPTFRLTAEAIAKDVDHIASLGVKFHYQHHIDKQRFSELQRSYDFVYLAIGAQKAKRLGIPNDQAKGVVDFLWFLSQVRRGHKVDLGKNVIVLGGGNSAMDVARTAHRCVGKGGEVQIVYRRTRNEMPADREEIEALLHEGIKIRELTAPVSVVLENGKAVALRCSRMQLGEPDADGRRKPVKIEGADFDIAADSILPAIGQDVALDFVDGDLGTDPITGQTKLAKVFAGGDLVRGAATVIKAIGDGKGVALNIIKAANRRIPLFAKRESKGLSRLEYRLRRAKRLPGAQIPTIEGQDRKTFKLVNLRLDEATARAEAARCLFCDDFCGICATVCPNRANVNYTAQPGDYPVFRGVRDGDVLVLKQEGTFRVEQEPQVLNV